ncbi:hypothetical protein WMY93_022737 [Mugilogobius chulae]|uniref:Uncharacterized protein n=1 Tax=Mugilogobius chulae TaxID=88201 RepID=A0AAW0NCN3_9GOBI
MRLLLLPLVLLVLETQAQERGSPFYALQEEGGAGREGADSPGALWEAAVQSGPGTKGDGTTQSLHTYATQLSIQGHTGGHKRGILGFTDSPEGERERGSRPKCQVWPRVSLYTGGRRFGGFEVEFSGFDYTCSRGVSSSFLPVLLFRMPSDLCPLTSPGLFPAILNLASNAEITANATCGEPVSEVYCKLVEHVPGRRIKNPHCPKCDSRSAVHKERHPIDNAIDGTNQWWQSPSIKNGRQFHWVTITLDLKQIFQVAYIIIKAANSPRPGNWILERSLDGVSFEPWQFYAISDSECLTRYNITPRLGRLLQERHRGHLHVLLQPPQPAGARRDPHVSDQWRYFYSIKDISIGGMCICYGHAQSCPLDPVTQKLHCVCEHNTCGENCNECCPGYHQMPWQPGTITEGNTCNCHNKAEDCFYNQTVSDLRLSLNAAGLRHGGGVCIDCQQNTAGVNCETCADEFYRPQGVSPYSDSPCVHVTVTQRFSFLSVCQRRLFSWCVSGQCPCREGFAGRRCDRCAFGYRDFPLCSKCECNLSGSTNTDPCEQCVCKKNVMGFNCDLCKPGFYNLQPENPHGCTDCFCFGVSDVCDFLQRLAPTCGPAPPTHRDPRQQLSPASQPLQRPRHQYEMSWDAPSSFLTNKLTSFKGTLSYMLFYDVPLDNLDRSLPAHTDVIIQGNSRSCVLIGPHQFVDDVRGSHVTRDELLTVLSDVTTLRVRVLLNSSAAGPIRLGLVSLDIADPMSVSGDKAVAVETCECPYGYSGTSCECVCQVSTASEESYLEGTVSSVIATSTRLCVITMDCACLVPTTPQGLIASIVCPVSMAMPLRGQSKTVRNAHVLDSAVQQSSGQVTCDRCQEGYTGNNCERCSDGFYGNPQVLGGSCLRCECNGNVDQEEPGHCDHVTGECLLCIRNTAGLHCERCRDGYYGDAVSAKNCTECLCDLSGALSSVCDVLSGRCDCKANVEGRACERCTFGFYGIESGQGCVPCSCSQSGSVSEFCDSEGRCLCVEGVAGDKCDRCARGYFNYQDGRCTECSCAHTGGNCNSETGQCICPPNTQGDKCEECKPDHWGHDAVMGCKSCSCSSSGSFNSQCDPISGQCSCREGFGGSSCDRCASGYYGYPECSPCGCDPAGTEEEFCNGTTGICDCLQDGQCVCKVNKNTAFKI